MAPGQVVSIRVWRCVDGIALHGAPRSRKGRYEAGPEKYPRSARTGLFPNIQIADIPALCGYAYGLAPLVAVI